MATKGFAAPEVGAAYTRARELCQQVGETPQLFPVSWAAGVSSGAGRVSTARELGEQTPHLGPAGARPGSLLEAHYWAGAVLIPSGRVGRCPRPLEQGLDPL